MSTLPDTIKEIQKFQIEYFKHFEKTIQDLSKSMVIIKKYVYPSFFTRMKNSFLSFSASYLTSFSIRKGVGLLSRIITKSSDLNNIINVFSQGKKPTEVSSTQLKDVFLNDLNNNSSESNKKENIISINITNQLGNDNPTKDGEFNKNSFEELPPNLNKGQYASLRSSLHKNQLIVLAFTSRFSAIFGFFSAKIKKKFKHSNLMLERRE